MSRSEDLSARLAQWSKRYYDHLGSTETSPNSSRFGALLRRDVRARRSIVSVSCSETLRHTGAVQCSAGAALENLLTGCEVRDVTDTILGKDLRRVI